MPTTYAGQQPRRRPLPVLARRADHNDAAIGLRLRSRRLELGLSQTELGAKIGVTFQQIQKYEKGMNRVGGGRLFRCCEALGVQAEYFFGKQTEKSTGSVLTELAQDRWALRFLEAYRKAKDHEAIRHLILLAERLAEH